MDLVRSCSVMRARLSAGSNRETWVRWFRAEPAAEVFPGLHAFGHPIWEAHPNEFEGPGIFLAGDQWRPNAWPAPPGDHFEGLIGWYQTGLPPGPPPIPAAPCGQQGVVSQGGFCVCGSSWPAHAGIFSALHAGGRPGLSSPVVTTYRAASVTTAGGKPADTHRAFTVLFPITAGGVPALASPVVFTYRAASVTTGGGVPALASPVVFTYLATSLTVGGGSPADQHQAEPLARAITAGGVPSLASPVVFTYRAASVTTGGGVPAGLAQAEPLVRAITAGGVPGLASAVVVTYKAASVTTGGATPGATVHPFTGAYAIAYSSAWDVFR